MKSFHTIALLLTILLALVLRFYQLGTNPPSLDWDEASLGYNAYSILKTGADEYGTKFPIAIRSFNDYKPPLYTYLAVPSVAAFGLNEFSVRFPSAFFGVLTVIATFFLVKELFGKNIALISALFLAISPWHLQFSRVAFEANVALFFFVLGVWFFLLGVKDGKFILFSSLAFVASVYTYHSPRLVAPLFLAGLAWHFRKELLRQKKWLVLSFIIGLLLALPILVEMRRQGAGRFTSVTTLTPEGNLSRSIAQAEYDQKRGDPLTTIIHNRRVIYFLNGVGGYLDHFNFDFLFLDGDQTDRHHAVDMGMLYFWDLPFVLLGIFYLLRGKEKNAFVLFWWFLVAPAASAVTTGTPHAVRALLYLPTYQIFSALGFWQAYLVVKARWGKIKAKAFVLALSLFLFLNFIYYLHMYYVHTPIETSQDWQYGYKELVFSVNQLEGRFQKVIITYGWDQPYIYFLFYNKVDPTWYQTVAPKGDFDRFHRSFGKFDFRKLDFENDRNLKNALVVGTPREIGGGAPDIVKTIKFLNGEVAFRIVALP